MTRVKICGLMNKEDVELCVKAGVHCTGFVVDYPVTVPWNLNKNEARLLIEKVPPFVNTSVVTGGSVDKILAIAEATYPNIIQLHYQETLAEVHYLAHYLSLMGIKTIKALRINSSGKCAFEITDPAVAAQALSKTKVSALLVDSHTPTMPGGTGVTVDLSTFKTIRYASTLPVVLAGGLNPANITNIIQEADPFAVDVLTGVEERSGKKDPKKVYEFMQKVSRITGMLDTFANPVNKKCT